MRNHVEVSEDDLTPQALLPNLVIQVVVSIMMDPALVMQVVVRIRLEVGRPIEEEIPSEDTIVVDSDGTRSMSRGSKRLLDMTIHDEVTLAEDSTSRKRPLEDGEPGGLMDVMLSENFGYVCGLEEVSCKFTGEDLILKVFGDVQSLAYQGKQNAKAISFCGKSLKVWEPDLGVDDSTLQQLDGGDTFEGMLTEMANLEANKFGVKIICCRWMTNAKVIKDKMGVDKMGVRARIVVKDVAVGPKAKNLEIFSPTPCAESIKVAAHIFLSWDHGADWKASVGPISRHGICQIRTGCEEGKDLTGHVASYHARKTCC